MRHLSIILPAVLLVVGRGNSQLSSNASQWLKGINWKGSTTTEVPARASTERSILLAVRESWRTPQGQKVIRQRQWNFGAPVADCYINGKPGVCTSLFICDDPQQADPTDKLFDYRMWGCPGDYDVCCLPEKIQKTNSTSSSSSTSTSTSTTSSTPTTSTTTTKPRIAGCGASRPGGYRVVTSEFSEYAEYPWVIALVRNGKVVGGGSIIHPSAVLTASHKVANTEAREWTCRAGEWDLDQQKLINTRQNRDVNKIVLNEDRKLPLVGTSAALLFLKTPFDISSDTPHVGIACLYKNPPKVNTDCEVMGWGATNFNDKEQDYSRKLKKAVVPTVEHEQCASMLRKTRLGPRFNLHESFTCAGGKTNEDACTGDGGAPLVCPISSDGMRYAVAGIVAWGVGCGSNIPGVYVDVPHYYEWIATQMMEEGLDTETYNY